MKQQRELTKRRKERYVRDFISWAEGQQPRDAEVSLINRYCRECLRPYYDNRKLVRQFLISLRA